MTSQTLREARRYEETTEAVIANEERPAFHLSARVGWMNDPNGFSLYKGEYHMFYQYHPYDTIWGPMHWAHAVSKDLLHWSCLPTALAPDTSYDRDGCFSGSAIELADGRQLLMYTGVARQTQPDGGMKEVQTQCIAVGDGVDYEKYAANPVLTAEDLPEGASRFDFRDPKLWREDDGTYTCVVGNRPADGSGQLLLFTSDDAFSWKFKSILAKNENRYGKMWECPDLFELDGKWVILTSPQDMMPEGFEYHNGNGTLCLIGSYDRESGTFAEERNQAIDYGIDFYAPQTILTPDGRRVMIGWMQNWDTCNFHKPEKPWFGQMSLPRELSIRDGRLIQNPIRELEALRSEKVGHDNVCFSGELRFDDVRGRRLDLTVSVRPKDVSRIYHKFEVVFAENEKYRSHISFRPYEQIVKIDRKFSGSRRAIIHQRRCFTASGEDGRIKMRIILDNFSVEVFINDGEQVLSATLYTDLSANGILFFADGEVSMDVVSYELTR